MNTMSAATITPTEAAKLWYDAIDGAYSDTPTDETALCLNCYRAYSKHTGLTCPPNGNDGGNAGYEFLGGTGDYLTDRFREGGLIEPKLVAAYEATKRISYADMPAYDASDIHNPLDVMAYLPETDWLEAMAEPLEWLEGWANYTEAVSTTTQEDDGITPLRFFSMSMDARIDMSATVLKDADATFVEKSFARRGLEIDRATNNYDMLAAFKALDGFRDDTREWAVCRERLEGCQQRGRKIDAALKGL